MLVLLQFAIHKNQLFQHLKTGARPMEAIAHAPQHVRNIVLVRAQLVKQQPRHRLIVRLTGVPQKQAVRTVAPRIETIGQRQWQRIKVVGRLGGGRFIVVADERQLADGLVQRADGQVVVVDGQPEFELL